MKDCLLYIPLDFAWSFWFIEKLITFFGPPFSGLSSSRLIKLKCFGFLWFNLLTSPAVFRSEYFCSSRADFGSPTCFLFFFDFFALMVELVKDTWIGVANVFLAGICVLSLAPWKLVMFGIVPFVDLIGCFLSVGSPPISLMASGKPLGFLVLLG